MSERQRYFEAVIIVFIKDNKVLLHRRKNTGWCDGWFDVPSGHIDSGESITDAASREAQEEVGIKVVAKNLQLFHISQADTGNGQPYTYFVFKALSWEGQPILLEPDLAEDLDFYSLDNLPNKIPPYTKSAIESINAKDVTFSYHGSEQFE